MELPRGITGFDVIDRPGMPDEETFRRDCREIVPRMGGRVLDRSETEPTPITNFLEVVVEWPGWRVAILRNAVYPWVGFREPLGPGEILSRFIDPLPLIRGFEAVGRYRVLPVVELDRPASEAMCGQFRRSELSQFRYWRKTYGGDRLRVGDVVFNHWD